jgi:peroxiredoxin
MASEHAYPGLKLGQQAPGFQVLDSTGASCSLDSLIATGPRVFVFYRGHW